MNHKIYTALVGCPITETKRIGHLGSMKPFSEGEPGFLGQYMEVGITGMTSFQETSSESTG